MSNHFEDLWIKCENFYRDKLSKDDPIDIIQELTIKLGLYSAICKQEKIPDKEAAKSHLMGEILLSLTKLSYEDNINVYAALHAALIQNNISKLTTKDD